MFSFNESNWHNEAEHSQLKDAHWEHDPLSLQPLSDRPFDILDVISTSRELEEIPQAPESVTTSVISSQDQRIDLDFEEKDIWTTQHTTTTFNTLSWDTHNIHFPSFAQTELAKKHIGTPFITEAPIKVFEPIIQSRSVGKPVYEIDLVKSLVGVLVGSPSAYFYWHQNEFQMRISTVRLLGMSVSTIQPMINELLYFATLLKKLESAASTCKNTPNRYGLTGVAMGCCLEEFHINIQQQIYTLFENEQHVTVLKVYQYVNNLFSTTEKLCKLCCIGIEPEEVLNSEQQKKDIEEYGFYLPFGVDIINLVHSEIEYYDLVESFYKDICLSMLQYISIPFTAILNKWLGLESEYSGIFDDPYHEFFIITYTNKTSILDRFDIRTNAKLPYFVNNDMSIYIFRSGLSLQLLKKTTPQHPIFNLKETIPLKLLLENIDSEKYISSIQDICQHIQAYNMGTPLLDTQVIHDDDGDVDIIMQDDDNSDDIPFQLSFLDTKIDLKGDFLNSLTKLLQHEQQSTSFIPTMDTITHQSYLKSIEIWCPTLNESFMSSFLHQFKLEYHLSLLYNHYLFASSNFVIGLENTFFKSGICLSHQHQWPPTLSDLNISLVDLLIDEKLFTFKIRDTNETSLWLNPHSIEALDFLELNYHTSYPLNIVITQPILDKYNRIFTFVLKLLHVKIVTKRTFQKIKELSWFRSTTKDKISRFRWTLEQYILSIVGYVHHTAIQNTWSKFMSNVKEMKTNTAHVSFIMEPHTFKEYHQHILDCILYQCFLKRSHLQVLQELYPVLNDILIFGQVLDDYEAIDIMTEDKLFLKCRKLYEQFRTHTNIFIRILSNIEERGYGRLSSILSSNQTPSIFTHLYSRHEAKDELDLFVKDLSIRLNMNGFYE